jgi:hypothetical protein
LTRHFPLVRFPPPAVREGGGGSNPCSGVEAGGEPFFDPAYA